MTKSHNAWLRLLDLTGRELLDILRQSGYTAQNITYSTKIYESLTGWKATDAKESEIVDLIGECQPVTFWVWMDAASYSEIVGDDYNLENVSAAAEANLDALRSRL